MKKIFIVMFFFVTLSVWGQSAWLYDQQWGGLTQYEGSGRAKFDDAADLNNNWSGGRLQRIERATNEQIKIINHGLQQYRVRSNDVYTVLFINDFSKRHYVALIIITEPNNSGGSSGYSYYLWEDLSYRR